VRRLLGSFNTKVLGLTLLVVLGSQATTVYAVLEYARHEVLARADADLADAETAFHEALSHRAAALARIMEPALRSRELQSAVRTRDVATMRRALLARIDQANADFGLLLNQAGSVLVTSSSADLSGADYGALAASERQLLVTPGPSYDMVTLPLATEAGNGWLSVGYRIDDGLARRLAKAADTEITLLRTSNSGTISVLGSSLANEERALLLDATEQIAAGVPFVEATETLGSLFRSARQSYVDGDSRIVALTHKRFGEARQPFVALQGALLHASTISLLGALGLALLLSRAVTQPVRELLLATRRMSVGNYTQKLSIRSRDEFGELAHALETMREGIAQREQRIVYQAEFDPLTGLPNRIQATELLRSALREASQSGNSVVVFPGIAAPVKTPLIGPVESAVETRRWR